MLDHSSPGELGFRADFATTLRSAFHDEVIEGRLAGAVMVVARRGKIALFDAVGFRDRQNRSVMPADAIFRLASLSKPVTSVAALILVERGLLDLSWPVHRLVPEFKSVQVGEEISSEGIQRLALRNPSRPPRIWDLLRHTSGLTYGIFGRSAIKDLYRRADMLDTSQTSASMAAKLSSLPLAYDPGSTWEYGMSTDLLGHIVEVVSGKTLDHFIADEIGQTLGLDTFGYWIPERNLDRVAEAADAEAGSGLAAPVPTSEPSWPMAGGGMVGTALDYAKFAQMLLDQGAFGGKRIVSRKTVELMTGDQLPRGLPRNKQFLDIMSDLAPAEEYAQSFGLGVAVRTAIGPSPVPGSVGDFFWQGVTGPYFWVDPTERLVAVLMIQVPFYRTDRYRRMFRRLVYSQLE